MPGHRITREHAWRLLCNQSVVVVICLGCQAAPHSSVNPVTPGKVSAPKGAFATSSSSVAPEPTSSSVGGMAMASVGAAVPPRPEPVPPPESSAATSEPNNGTPPLDWDRRFVLLYGSYEKGPLARAKAYTSLFSKDLQKYLGKRNVTREAAIKLMEGFFRTRPNPYYVLRGPVVTASSGVAMVPVEAKWEEPCQAEWASENFTCYRRVRLEATSQLDERGQINWLDEAAGPKYRYRVAADSVSGYETPHSGCEDLHGKSADVALSKGDVVEATGRFIHSFGCGPYEALMQFRYEGQSYWTILSSGTRVYDEETGPHTGGEDFLTEEP